MEPPTTGKIAITTNRGLLTAELWCKECPLNTKGLMEYISKDQLNGTVINSYDKYIEIGIKWPVAPIKESNTRLKFNRGYIGVLEDSIFITKEKGVYNGFVIGKLVGDSYYNLQELENQEYENFVRSGEVLVDYFGVGRKGSEREVDPETEVDPEKMVKSEKKVVKQKKKRIKLDYEVEEDGFEMKSAYELLPRGKKGEGPEKHGEEQSEELEKLKKQGEVEVEGPDTEATEPDTEAIQQDAEAPVAEAPVAEAPVVEAPDTVEPVEESPLATQPQTKSPAQIPNPLPFDEYKDIPMESLKAHKYIRSIHQS